MNSNKLKYNRFWAIVSYKRIILAFIITVFLSACNGFHQEIVEVKIPVDDVADVIVINGEIEKNAYVWVQISYSEDVDAPVGTSVNFEKNAAVTLTTASGLSETLKYWQNGYYYGATIVGKVGETYTLSIMVNGQTYNATSVMIPTPGFKDAWVVAYSGDGKGKTGTEGKSEGSTGIAFYSEEWIVNDPSTTRNRYLFEWHTNGNHLVRKDWAMDDNRIVNSKEGLRMFNPTINPGANEYTLLRVAEIDKLTYDYFNMYEKIVRGMVGADAQTPFNPVSNFGEGSMGNFRAVEFSSIAILTPPNLLATGQNEQVVISFPTNEYFTKYNLCWSNTAGITKEKANKISDIKFKVSENYANYAHVNLTNGKKYYYRVEVEDASGKVSVLSGEVSAAPDSGIPADNPVVPPVKVPVNVKAVTGSNPGEIIISWDPAQGAPQYGIYWSTKPGITLSLPKENQIWGGKDGAVLSPYILTGLKSGVTYYFRVAAWDGKVVELSAEVSAIAK